MQIVCNFPTILHHIKNENRKFNDSVFAQSVFTEDSNELLQDNKNLRMNIHLRNRVIYDHELESIEIYDTLTQSDIVRSQYISLPYPLVTNQQLQDEKCTMRAHIRYEKYPIKSIMVSHWKQSIAFYTKVEILSGMH